MAPKGWAQPGLPKLYSLISVAQAGRKMRFLMCMFVYFKWLPSECFLFCPFPHSISFCWWFTDCQTTVAERYGSEKRHSPCPLGVGSLVEGVILNYMTHDGNSWWVGWGRSPGWKHVTRRLDLWQGPSVASSRKSEIEADTPIKRSYLTEEWQGAMGLCVWFQILSRHQRKSLGSSSVWGKSCMEPGK